MSLTDLCIQNLIQNNVSLIIAMNYLPFDLYQKYKIKYMEQEMKQIISEMYRPSFIDFCDSYHISIIKYITMHPNEWYTETTIWMPRREYIAITNGKRNAEQTEYDSRQIFNCMCHHIARIGMYRYTRCNENHPIISEELYKQLKIIACSALYDGYIYLYPGLHLYMGMSALAYSN